MNGVGLFSQQASEELQKEGLPYWIFWLLLCIILLLVAFIFLRDKDLRQRLNAFLSGAKRRMKRTQLQIRLNKEKRQKADLVRALGKRVWEGKIQNEKFLATFKELASLEGQDSGCQAELKDILAKIMTLKKEQEEARQRYKSLTKMKESGQQPDIEQARTAKDKAKHSKKEIKVLEKRILTGQATLKDIQSHKDRNFEQLGTFMDEKRLDLQEYQPIYAQIDELNRNILNLMSRIEKLA
jgi:predicted  nucleic acid-binding Zn-ribbon protein